jgi:S1-C subfamily serine protease
MQDTARRGGGRETRLLLVTIAVSVATLLLLARFRFPEDGAVRTDPTPAPLERLAGRATFDELASIMADLERRIAPAVTVLEVRADAPGMAYVPALRLTDDRAVALVGKDDQISQPDQDAPPILTRDPARSLVVVQVPSAPDSAVSVRTGAVRQGPRYIAVVEATRQGPAVRPVYVGRTDIIQDPRGTGALYTVGAAQQTLTEGSAVFSLDGTLIGLAAETAGVITIVPGDALRKIVEEAPAGPGSPGDLGIEVQAMSPAVARAAKVATGVIVSYVDPSGPAAGTLQPADVVQSIDSIPITTVAGFQVVAQTRPRGAAVALGIIRRGAASSVKVTAAGGPPRAPQPADGIGAVLRDAPGAGAEIVTVTRDSPAARAGLLRGDIITFIEGRGAPDGATIERAFRTLEAGGVLLVNVQRGAQYRIVAVEKS